jgi:DNA-binding MarR family transcriptional regulator
VKDSGEPDPLLWSLLETADLLRARMEEGLKAVGLSMAKTQILYQLVQAGGPVSLRTLAEAHHCVPSNMTTLMDRLESDGLVRRVDDPSDRRSVLAELTALGVEKAQAGMDVMMKVQRQFSDSLPARERATLSRMLKAIRG